MKCPECGYRNDNANNFCMSCVSPLKKISKTNRVVMPPQNIANSLRGKSSQLPVVYKPLSPMVVPVAMLMIGFITAYYFIYHVDTYKVQAIEYYSFDGSPESTQ